MKYLYYICLCFLLLVNGAVATTWDESTQKDPLTGDQVQAHDIMSYGSYIYHWPSKYDLVFWPLIDVNWITLNPKNGYAAFHNDFETLSEAEKKTLKIWLEKNYTINQVPKSHEEKLLWLEKVYQQRNMKDDFWNTFYRLMVYFYRTNGQTDQSLGYVKKVIPYLETQLKANPDSVKKIELLFLLGEYNHRLGFIDKGNDYFAEIKAMSYQDKDSKESVTHSYFIKLIDDRKSENQTH